MENRSFRKSLAVAIVVLFLGVSVIPNVVGDNPSFENTIYVDDDNTDGPWDGTQEHPYKHIQDGIDNASDGDTVFVYSGIYNELLNVNKSINLIGENRNVTIIDGSQFNGNIIDISVNNVNINNFLIQGSYNTSGINVNSRYNKLSWNIIKNNYDGIYLKRSCNNSISYNLLENFEYNIYLIHDSNSNNVSYNTILDGGSDGVMLHDSSKNIVFNNIIEENTYGIRLLESYDTKITYNTIKSNSGGIVIHEPDRTDKQFAFISNNVIAGNYRGIDAGGGSFSNIVSNSIYDNSIGIYFTPRYGVTKSVNFVKNNLFQNKDNAYFRYTQIPYNDPDMIIKTIKFFENLETIKWDGNYWDDISSNARIKIIKGKLVFINAPWRYFAIPWFAIDWHPAREPYDIS